MSADQTRETPTTTARQTRTLLAFDYGRRRIGIAVGNESPATATPLASVRCDCPGPDWDRIGALIGEWHPQLLVVGHPANADGTASEMSAEAEGFAAALTRRYALEVELIDERFTSLEASQMLREQRRLGVRRRVRRGDVDEVAAQLILNSWLNQQGGAS